MPRIIRKYTQPAYQAHSSASATALLDASMRSGSTLTFGSQSSKASSLFDLDENGTKPILVYKFRSDATSLEVKTERDLCAEIDTGRCMPGPNNDPLLPYLHVTRKPISRLDTHLEILHEDLLPESVRRDIAGILVKASLAEVTLPMLVALRHWLTGAFDTLYIVSRAPHPWPDARKNDLPASSQHDSSAAILLHEAQRHRDV